MKNGGPARGRRFHIVVPASLLYYSHNTVGERQMRTIFLTSLFALAACGGSGTGQAGGSGAERRSYDVGSFDAVALGGAQDVVVRTGAPVAVYAEGSADDLDRLDIKVENGELRIGNKRNMGWIFSPGRSGRVTVHVTVPSLARAAIGGAGDITIDTVNGKAFDGAIAGAGNIQVGALRTDLATFSIAGSGDIRASGASPQVKVSIMGSGGVDAGGVASRTADISIAGSGNAVVHASETAQVNIAGSGDATVRGGAKCSISKVGSGSVNCTG